jgi:hypothetical protein
LRHIFRAGRCGLEGRGAAHDLAGLEGGHRRQVAVDGVAKDEAHWSSEGLDRVSAAVSGIVEEP